MYNPVEAFQEYSYKKHLIIVCLYRVFLRTVHGEPEYVWEASACRKGAREYMSFFRSHNREEAKDAFLRMLEQFPKDKKGAAA